MNKIWWLWVPVAAMLAQIVLEISLSGHPGILAHLHSEDGPHEAVQFLFIAAAFVIAVIALAQMDLKAKKWLAAWIGLAAICCFYVAGEEISWGQHILKWSTPDYWAHFNDQQETNLHNTSSWLDQKPRLLLEIGIVTGGLLIPLMMKYKPALVPARFNIIYPPPYLAVIALLALFVKLAEKLAGAMGIVIFERASEIEELYLFYFVFLYLIVIRKRAL